jgi:hypothetical protein
LIEFKQRSATKSNNINSRSRSSGRNVSVGGGSISEEIITCRGNIVKIN